MKNPSLEQSIANVEELIYEVKNKLFLPKRFRRMRPGPALDSALSKYVEYLKEEHKRLKNLLKSTH